MASLSAIVPDPMESGEGPAPEPQVFVRTFTTPVGMPWDQARAAGLEARHGAPLPIADLHHRVRRLEGWTAGQLGRYAAFYVRRKDLRAPFETTLEVDGKLIRIGFGTRADPLRGMRQAALVAVAIAAPVVVAAGFLVLAWSARLDAVQQLDTLERQVDAKTRLAAKVRQEEAQTRAFVASQGRAGELGDLVSDLTWLANARKPDARILSVHWDHGLMAVEARGTVAPVDPGVRQVMRASRPTPAGTWLWGISRTARPVTAAPVEPRRDGR